MAQANDVKIEPPSYEKEAKVEPAKALFPLESVMAAIQTSLGQASLNQRSVQDWLILTRSDFDCVVLDNPYLAQSFWLHLSTGRFTSRVWNKILATGFVADLETAVQKIWEYFDGTAPCLGIIGGLEDEDNVVTESYIISDLPYKRKISSNCLSIASKTTATRDGSNSTATAIELLCEPCLVMKELDTAEDVEQLSEKEDGEDSVDDSEDEVEKYEKKQKKGEKLSNKVGAAKVEVNNKKLKEVELENGEKKFHCLKCTRTTFSARDLLYKHQVRQHQRGSYRCSHCQDSKIDPAAVFQYPEELETHLKDSHPSAENTVCSVCDNKVPTTEEPGFVAHVRECVKERDAARRLLFLAEKERTGYQCLYCDLTFLTEFKRQTHHNKDHLQREKKVYSCHACDKTFTHGTAMKRHMALNHAFGKFRCQECCGDAVLFEFADDFLNHLTSSHSGVSSATCDMCDESIEIAQYKDHNLVCKKEKASIKRRNYKASIRARGVKCRYCEEVLEDHTLRMVHEHKEHKGYRYTCHLCDYKTCYKQQFIRHKAIHEGSLEKACCDHCGKEMSKERLKSHIEYQHKGKVDNATCEVCGQVFNRKMQLEKHKILEHGIGNPFVCIDCGKAFGSRCNLYSHRKVHSEGKFVCNICGKASKTKQNHEAHERTHTGEKPFK